MPTRARSDGRSVLGSLTLMPSRMISPFWNGSSALTHLIRVDFPEPDGPHTTTTSPLATEVVQSFSAWKLLLYHLSTWLISIMRPQCPCYRTIAIRCCRRLTPNDAKQEIRK